MQNGVKRSKVAELECQATRSAPHLQGDLFDDGVPFVQTTKGEFAIEVEGDEALVPTPRDAGRSSHRMNLPGSPAGRSLKSGLEDLCFSSFLNKNRDSTKQDQKTTGVNNTL